MIIASLGKTFREGTTTTNSYRVPINMAVPAMAQTPVTGLWIVAGNQ